jgi:outer membrane protein
MQKYPLLLILFAGLSFSSAAQEKLRVTIDDCLRLGLQKNKTLKISQSKANAAEARHSEMSVQRLPSLKLFTSYTRLSAVDPFVLTTPYGVFNISPSILNNYNVRLTAQQTLFSGFRLQNNTAIAEYNESAALQDLKKDKSQLVLDIRTAYWNYYRAIEMKRALDETVAQAKSHQRDIERFQDQGMATLNDVLKVKVQVSNAAVSLIDAENNVQLTSMSLANTIGIPLNTEIEINTAADTAPDAVIDETEAYRTALETRADVRSMEYRLKAGEAGVSLAKASWYPQINFSANYYYQRPNQRIMPAVDQFKETWDIGVNLSYDLWNWRTTAFQSEQAEQTLEQTRTAFDQLKDGISLELAQAVTTLNKSKLKIAAAADALKQAEENFRVTNEKFKGGLAINSDVLDAEGALLQAKLNAASAIADYQIALARYEKAVGQ